MDIISDDMTLYKTDGADALYYQEELLLSFASDDVIRFCKQSKEIYFYVNNRWNWETLLGLSNQLRMIACNKGDKKAAKALEKFRHDMWKRNNSG